MLVEVKALCKKYPTFLLDNVSFSVKEGEITGFVGRNGAGKTTVIKSILNLVHADSGEVKYFGLPLLSHESEIKQRIGYSTGAVNYYPKKSIKLIAKVTSSLYPTWDCELYHKYLSMFGLDENKTPSELSEGMKVKLNLLLALSHRPEILILDEPTSGLDPFSREELLDIFGTLKQSGVAVFFSTHIISDLEKCADNIIYIRDGKLVADCRLNEFLSSYGASNEPLEDVILRMERSDYHD